MSVNAYKFLEFLADPTALTNAFTVPNRAQTGFSIRPQAFIFL
jgi:hypothetical protein